MQWPGIEPIRSERLLLDPLRVEDAEAMLPVLGDAPLYAYTGGEPPTLGRSVATEAALAMTCWLRAHGVEDLRAHVHPRHDASARVALRLGLRRTDVWNDGEIRWERSMRRPS